MRTFYTIKLSLFVPLQQQQRASICIKSLTCPFKQIAILCKYLKSVNAPDLLQNKYELSLIMHLFKIYKIDSVLISTTFGIIL